MAKILTITLNPAIDVTVELDTLNIGEVNRQKASQSHAAGKGLNVAQVLRDLGHNLVVSGFLGQGNRQIFDQHFEAQSFDNQFIYVEGETRQNIKVAESSGRMTDINGKGFWVSDEAKQALKQELENIQVDAVVISGSLPQNFSVQEFADLITWFKQQGHKVAVDTSGQALEAAIAVSPWLIKPNTDELTETYHLPATTFAEQQAIFAKQQTQIENIVVSMGEHGVNWLRKTDSMHASAPKVKVKSTVGAGDSMVAGMVHGLLSQHTPQETLQTATAIASNAVTQIGFQLPPLSTIEDLKQQISISSLG